MDIRVFHGIPFRKEGNRYAASLPAARMKINQLADGVLIGYLNGDRVAWPTPPTSVEGAVKILLDRAHEEAQRLLNALKTPGGPVYIFTKSGSAVQIVGLANPYMGQPCVTVRKVAMAGEMPVPVRSLVLEAAQEEEP